MPFGSLGDPWATLEGTSAPKGSPPKWNRTIKRQGMATPFSHFEAQSDDFSIPNMARDPNTFQTRNFSLKVVRCTSSKFNSKEHDTDMANMENGRLAIQLVFAIRSSGFPCYPSRACRNQHMNLKH